MHSLLEGKVNKNLSEWLQWIRLLRVNEMDLSLERVKEMAGRLGVLDPRCPVITVAGTNGKGSCVAGLEAIYLQAGYRVGAFTTPFLWRYNEQVRLQGVSAADALFCDAFERIVEKRGDLDLTLFEFGALAAFILFQEAELDVWILEVGLGGRWDAVNVIDADVAIVSSIALDHMEWLGDTREVIAREKAGIFRSGSPVVCGDLNPPHTLIEIASSLHAPFFCQGKAFSYVEKESSWDFTFLEKEHKSLFIPRLGLQNMSTVLATVELLQKNLPVSFNEMNEGLKKITLPGRIQVIPGEKSVIYDVSHNPAAAEWLAAYLKKNPVSGKTIAVFSMLADKDIFSTILVMKDYVDHWHIAPLDVPRGVSEERLLEDFNKAGLEHFTMHLSIEEAYASADQCSHKGDRIVVFGSFRTVAAVTSLDFA